MQCIYYIIVESRQDIVNAKNTTKREEKREREPEQKHQKDLR